MTPGSAAASHKARFRAFLRLIEGRGAELAQAAGYQTNLVAVPDPPSATLAIGGTYEARISLLPGSYVLGFSGTSQRAAGFEAMVEDLGAQARFFNRPLRLPNITGQAGGSPPYSRVFYLPEPRLILEPAVLSVRLRNLDTGNTNAVQFVIHSLEPVCL